MLDVKQWAEIRRLIRVNEMVLSPYANGGTNAEISTYLAEINHAPDEQGDHLRVTDKAREEMTDWY